MEVTIACCVIRMGRVGPPSVLRSCRRAGAAVLARAPNVLRERASWPRSYSRLGSHAALPALLQGALPCAFRDDCLLDRFGLAPRIYLGREARLGLQINALRRAG